MRRTKDPFQQIESGGGPGGRGGAPSSSLRGSQWAKGPRPTEMPKSKMELRAAQRAAQRPPVDEEARAARKKKFGIGFNKGGMVGRDYCK